jgi:hypothetical protein
VSLQHSILTLAACKRSQRDIAKPLGIHRETVGRFRIVYLEYEYVRVGILPEIGGRLFEAVDKSNKYDLIYRQHVIKPAHQPDRSVDFRWKRWDGHVGTFYQSCAKAGVAQKSRTSSLPPEGSATSETTGLASCSFAESFHSTHYEP